MFYFCRPILIKFLWRAQKKKDFKKHYGSLLSRIYLNLIANTYFFKIQKNSSDMRSNNKYVFQKLFYVLLKPDPQRKSTIVGKSNDPLGKY